MTATISRASREAALTARLAELRAERDQALAEIIPAGDGDMADRATNVDGHVRLAVLEERIATIEGELATTHTHSARPAKGAVAPGDLVVLDFGDGPESFLFGSLDQAADGLDVITPSSPLGRALQGARIGATLTYAAGPNRNLHATLIAVN